MQFKLYRRLLYLFVRKMVEATLSDVKMVALPGIKSVFRVYPKDVLVVDDQQYVKLDVQSHTLSQIICENNAEAPDLDGKGRKATVLATCLGLSDMVRKRNEILSMQPSNSTAQSKSTLFASVAKDKKKPKQQKKTRKLELN